jgi:hypothetical protein
MNSFNEKLSEKWALLKVWEHPWLWLCVLVKKLEQVLIIIEKRENKKAE